MQSDRTRQQADDQAATLQELQEGGGASQDSLGPFPSDAAVSALGITLDRAPQILSTLTNEDSNDAWLATPNEVAHVCCEPVRYAHLVWMIHG